MLSALRRVESRGAIETTHRILQTCGQIFRYGIVTGRTERDISADNKPLAIEASDVARMKSYHPKKVNLNIQSYLSETCDEVINDGGHDEEYCWKSIWVEEEIANHVLDIRTNINNSNEVL